MAAAILIATCLQSKCENKTEGLNKEENTNVSQVRWDWLPYEGLGHLNYLKELGKYSLILIVSNNIYSCLIRINYIVQ